MYLNWLKKRKDEKFEKKKNAERRNEREKKMKTKRKMGWEVVERKIRFNVKT